MEYPLVNHQITEIKLSPFNHQSPIHHRWLSQGFSWFNHRSTWLNHLFCWWNHRWITILVTWTTFFRALNMAKPPFLCTIFVEEWLHTATFSLSVSLGLRKVHHVSFVHAPHEAQISAAEIVVHGPEVLDHRRQHRQVDPDGNDGP